MLDEVINEIEETRSLDPLKKLKKENLIKVAAHYRITPAVGATKYHILDLTKDHCVENDIINKVEEKPIAETAEVVKLKLEFQPEERRFQHEERRLEHKEAQRARDATEAVAQRAHEEAQKAYAEARELRLAELKEAHELRELELKASEKSRTSTFRGREKAAAREHELKMASLGKHSSSDKASAFDPARNIRLVPPF